MGRFARFGTIYAVWGLGGAGGCGLWGLGGGVVLLSVRLQASFMGVFHVF